MPGAIAPNLHEGSRSEILADYLFSSWGTVTPVRRQEAARRLPVLGEDGSAKLQLSSDGIVATSRTSRVSRE